MMLANTLNTIILGRSRYLDYLHLPANANCKPFSRVLTDLGAKARVMDLMTHENSDVRYQALVTVQQLVSQPWQAV